MTYPNYKEIAEQITRKADAVELVEYEPTVQEMFVYFRGGATAHVGTIGKSESEIAESLISIIERHD